MRVMIPLVKCAKPEHACAIVVHNGFTASGRQRYRCVPISGKPHTFSRDTATEESELDVFAQARPMRYRHTVEEVASALVLIGKGATYRQAAINSSAGLSDNAQRVVNWVERFAPVVTQLNNWRLWPSITAVDALAYRPGDHAGIVQLAVSTAADHTTPYLWKCLSAIERGDGGAWRNFFNAHSGRPEVLIVQRGSAAAVAALRIWADQPPLLIDPRRWNRERRTLHAHERSLPDVRGRFFESGLGPVLVRYLAEARRTVRKNLSYRHAHFKHLGRLDMVLALMMAEINGEADLTDYIQRVASHRATSTSQKQTSAATNISNLTRPTDFNQIPHRIRG